MYAFFFAVLCPLDVLFSPLAVDLNFSRFFMYRSIHIDEMTDRHVSLGGKVSAHHRYRVVLPEA